MNNKESTMTVFRRCATAVVAASCVLAMQVQADTTYAYAKVIESRPIYSIVEVSTPYQDCWSEEVPVRSRQSESRTPAILGTIIGGAIGNAVGHNKSNKRVGTVVGAVLGHSIGRDIVSGNGRDRQYYEVVQRCETAYDYREEERLVGYQVRYRFHGEEYSVRMDDDPGDEIRVRVDVQPVY